MNHEISTNLASTKAGVTAPQRKKLDSDWPVAIKPRLTGSHLQQMLPAKEQQLGLFPPCNADTAPRLHINQEYPNRFFQSR